MRPGPLAMTTDFTMVGAITLATALHIIELTIKGAKLYVDYPDRA